MTLTGHPRIAINPEVCGGRPIVAGTRMRVTDVLEMLAGGASAAEIAADFPYVGQEDVRAVLAYAAASFDHPVVLAAELSSSSTRSCRLPCAGGCATGDMRRNTSAGSGWSRRGTPRSPHARGWMVRCW